MNSSSLPALTLALGLIVGAGVGLLLGQGSSAASAAESSSNLAPIMRTGAAPPPTSSDTAGLAAVDPTAPLSATSQPQDGSSELTPSELRSAERAASSAARVAETAADGRDPSWTGVITGSIVDENGAPLVGATVMSYGKSSWNSSDVTAQLTDKIGRSFGGIDSLEGKLEDYATGELKRRKAFRSAVTDEAGAFQLDRLENGTHQVQAYLEGYVIESENVTTADATQLTGKRVALLHLELTLPSGDAPTEAVVLSLDSDDDENVLGKWTPSEPVLRTAKRALKLRIIAGTMQKIAWDEMAGEFSSEVRVLDLDQDGEGPHVFELKLVPQLHVHVKDESTVLPRTKPWVRIIRQEDKDTGVKRVKMKSRSGGPFIAKDLVPGAYEVTVGRGSDVAELTEVVDVAGGLQRLDLTVGDLDPAAFAIVKVVGPNGEAVADVDFRYRVERDGGSSSGGAREISRPGGEYWIPLARFSSSDSSEQAEPDGKVTLTATTSLYGSMEQPYLPGKGVLIFTFQSPGKVVVSVQNSSPKMRVNLRPLAETDGEPQHYWNRTRHSAKVEKDGLAVLAQVQPGDYTLELMPTDEQWSSKPPSVKEIITVKPGEQAVTLIAPELHELVIHAPDAKANTNMHLQLVGDDGALTQAGHDRLGDDQRVRFPGLAPGNYVLYSWGGDQQEQMEISVPCGEVLFEAMTIDSYEVLSVEKDKIAARAGLKKGDLILAVGEHEVKGVNFFNRLYLTLADGPAKLLVRRGGRNVTLDVEQMPETANGWSAFGAQSRPRSAGR